MRVRGARLWGSAVVFCTRCYGYVELRGFPSYNARCSFCGYQAKLIRRTHFKGDVAHLHGMLLINLSSEIGHKLLKLIEEKETVQRATQL